MNHHKELLHDGIEDDNDDEIDINRYDDFGNKIKPFEQYKMLCHQFHGKKPNKSKSKMKSSNKKLNKMKASEILKIRRNFNDTPLGMMNSTKKLLQKEQKPFVDLFFDPTMKSSLHNNSNININNDNNDSNGGKDNDNQK